MQVASFLILSPYLDPKALNSLVMGLPLSVAMIFRYPWLGFGWSLWDLCTVNNATGEDEEKMTLLIVYKAPDIASV